MIDSKKISVSKKHAHGSSKDLRRQHNADLIRRMRNGESLSAFDSAASWYPPRPIIKKDKREMSRLYQASDVTLEAASESMGQNQNDLGDSHGKAG